MNLELKRNQIVVKRIFDIFVSSIAIIFLAPLYIIIAILIKIDSTGKIIYTQDRIGKNGKIFKMYKFRTMKQNAEKMTGPILEKINDERVTKIGRYLRKTKLDESPQFINVLIGNMSIVGPRPERPELANEIKQEYNEFQIRELVKPGITGEACINSGYYALPQEKIKYDLKYMKNWSIKKDIKICMQTINFLIKGCKE